MGPLATVAGVMRVSDPSKGDPVPDIMTLWCVFLVFYDGWMDGWMDDGWMDGWMCVYA